MNPTRVTVRQTVSAVIDAVPDAVRDRAVVVKVNEFTVTLTVAGDRKRLVAMKDLLWHRLAAAHPYDLAEAMRDLITWTLA